MQAFVGGIILLNLGVLGLYIGRTYNQTKDRPLYVVSEVVFGQTRHDKQDKNP